MPNGAASTAAVRRQDRRHCVRRKVLANGEMIPVDLGPMESGLLLDICARGASVQGLKPLRPGVRISLEFRLPGSEVSVQPTYEVIWADPNGKIGLKFLYIAEREQRLLDQWTAAYFPSLEPEPAPEPPRPPDPGAIREPALATTMTLEQELARVVEQATGYTFAEGAAIALREEQGIVCRASWGNAPDVGMLLNPDSGLSGECIRTGAPISCADSLSDPRVDSVAARQLNLRSALVVPIKIDDQVQGLIEVLSSLPGAFTPAHLTSLERLAEIVGFLMGPPAALSTRESTAVAEPVRSESVSVASVRSESAPVAELAAHDVAPAPGTSASDVDPTETGEADAAGIIQLIEPELKPVSVTVPAVSVALTETVTSHVESAPEQSAEVAESPLAANPLPSVEKEARHTLRVGTLSAVVLACASLLIGAWFVTPRLAAKLRRNTIPAVAASSQPPVASQASLVPPAPVTDSAVPSIAVRSAPQKDGQASADTSSDEAVPSDDDDVTVVTWVNGKKVPVKGTGTGAAYESVPAPAAGSSPLRVTSQAMLDRIIDRPAPEYPEPARRQHIDGVVTLKVMVGTDGHVETATPISGPSILAVAAAKAVAQWRYRPYLLDGKPIRVETTVTVGFRRG